MPNTLEPTHEHLLDNASPPLDRLAVCAAAASTPKVYAPPTVTTYDILVNVTAGMNLTMREFEEIGTTIADLAVATGVAIAIGENADALAEAATSGSKNIVNKNINIKLGNIHVNVAVSSALK
jgi:hypothetical protein